MSPTNESTIRKAIADYEAGNCGDNIQTIMRVFNDEGLAYCAHNMALYGSTRFTRHKVVGRDTAIPCAEMDRRLRTNHELPKTKPPSDEDIYKVAREFDAFVSMTDRTDITPMLIGDEIVKFAKAVLFLYGTGPIPNALRNSSVGGERQDPQQEREGRNE